MARRWLLALSGGIGLVYLTLFLTLLRKVGPTDQDQFLVFHELQYWNSSFFGMAKQWTPLMCGGLSLAAEPQVPFMSLSMILAYVAGPFWALKAATVLYFIAGWFGTYQYAGLWLGKPEPRSSPHPCSLVTGFSLPVWYEPFQFHPFLTLPLLLWMLPSASDDRAGRPAAQSFLKQGTLALSMGAIIAMASRRVAHPNFHLLVWVGSHTVALAVVCRS